MSPFDYSFDAEQFNRLFPFYFITDNKMKIEYCGHSLKKLFPDCINRSFEDCFELKRPILTSLDQVSLKTICGELVLLKIKNDLQPTLRGQFEMISAGNRILFTGSPWFLSTEELNNSGLTINDFAAQDSLIDMLHILKSSDIVNQELKDLLTKINKQQKELKESRDKITAIAESLEKSNKRYEYVSIATSDAIWDWDLLTNEVYYGAGFEKKYGYNLEEINKDPNFWHNNIHPDDLKDTLKRFEATVESNEDSWTGEYRFKRADGSYAISNDTALIIRDERGNAIRVVGAVEDITKKKTEEYHLKMVESVIKNANDSVLITTGSEEQAIVFVNDAFCKMTGYSSEEVLGKTPRLLQGPKTDLNQLKIVRESIRQWKPCEVTVINYKKNGEEFWVNFSISPVINEEGVLTNWISIERDVTDIIRMNAEIAEQKKFTEDILNNIRADIAVFDKDHNYIYVNPHAVKDPERRKWLIGKNDFDYAKQSGADGTMANKRRQLFDEAVEKKSPVEWIDQHLTADGQPKYVLRNFYPHFEKHKLKFVIGYGIDVTETKLIEQKLQEALESIKIVNAELEQFAYIASHDLQEPLRMVSSFLQQLEKKYGEILDEKGKEYIHYAVDGAKRMRQIILDLLEFSRVGKTDGTLKEIDLNAITDEVSLLYHTKITELNAVLHIPKMPIITSYISPIRQVFQNLIGNSLKYHRKDVSPEITIAFKEKNNEWEFSVKDNGIGIDEQYFEKIFVIFQRLHNREEYSGTGIGLAITKKIVENLGGKIWLTSKKGEGSTFYFTLPKIQKTD